MKEKIHSLLPLLAMLLVGVTTSGASAQGRVSFLQDRGAIVGLGPSTREDIVTPDGGRIACFAGGAAAWHPQSWVPQPFAIYGAIFEFSGFGEACRSGYWRDPLLGTGLEGVSFTTGFPLGEEHDDPRWCPEGRAQTFIDFVGSKIACWNRHTGQTRWVHPPISFF